MASALQSTPSSEIYATRRLTYGEMLTAADWEDLVSAGYDQERDRGLVPFYSDDQFSYWRPAHFALQDMRDGVLPDADWRSSPQEFLNAPAYISVGQAIEGAIPPGSPMDDVITTGTVAPEVRSTDFIESYESTHTPSEPLPAQADMSLLPTMSTAKIDASTQAVKAMGSGVESDAPLPNALGLAESAGSSTFEMAEVDQASVHLPKTSAGSTASSDPALAADVACSRTSVDDSPTTTSTVATLSEFDPFRNSYQARDRLYQPRRQLKVPHGTDDVQRIIHDKSEHIKRVYQAIRILPVDPNDHEEEMISAFETKLAKFEDPSEYLQDVACLVVDRLIRLHCYGDNLLAFQTPCDLKSKDLTMTASERALEIVKALTRVKGICVDLLDGEDKIIRLVAFPISLTRRKRTNKAGNLKKKEILSAAPKRKRKRDEMTELDQVKRELAVAGAETDSSLGRIDSDFGVTNLKTEDNDDPKPRRSSRPKKPSTKARIVDATDEVESDQETVSEYEHEGADDGLDAVNVKVEHGRKSKPRRSSRPRKRSTKPRMVDAKDEAESHREVISEDEHEMVWVAENPRKKRARNNMK